MADYRDLSLGNLVPDDSMDDRRLYFADDQSCVDSSLYLSDDLFSENRDCKFFTNDQSLVDDDIYPSDHLRNNPTDDALSDDTPQSDNAIRSSNLLLDTNHQLDVNANLLSDRLRNDDDVVEPINTDQSTGAIDDVVEPSNHQQLDGDIVKEPNPPEESVDLSSKDHQPTDQPLDEPDTLQDGQPMDTGNEEELRCVQSEGKFYRHRYTYAAMAFSYSKDCPFEKTAKKFCIVTPTHVRCGEYRSDMWKKIEKELLDEGVNVVYVLGYREVAYVTDRFEHVTVKRAKIPSRRLDKFCRRCGIYCARKKAFAIFRYVTL